MYSESKDLCANVKNPNETVAVLRDMRDVMCGQVNNNRVPGIDLSKLSVRQQNAINNWVYLTINRYAEEIKSNEDKA